MNAVQHAWLGAVWDGRGSCQIREGRDLLGMGWQDQEIILGEGFGMGDGALGSASGVSRECSQGLCKIKYQCFLRLK